MGKDGTKPTDTFPPLFMATFMSEVNKEIAERVESRLETREKRKNKLIALFGNQCGECEKAYKPYMYDFHHVNPEIKEFKLSGDNLLRKWKTVLQEAHKCKMVCPNCHRYLHYKMERP